MNASAGPSDTGREDPQRPAVSPEARSWARQLTTLGHVGMMFPVSIAIGFLGGWWLDGRFGTGPWLALGGFLLGVAAAVRNLIQSVAAMDRAEEEEAAARREQSSWRLREPAGAGDENDDAGGAEGDSDA